VQPPAQQSVLTRTTAVSVMAQFSMGGSIRMEIVGLRFPTFHFFCLGVQGTKTLPIRCAIQLLLLFPLLMLLRKHAGALQPVAQMSTVMTVPTAMRFRIMDTHKSVLTKAPRAPVTELCSMGGSISREILGQRCPALQTSSLGVRVTAQAPPR